jgi:predicted phage terminase large subunit-like protein
MEVKFEQTGGSIAVRSADTPHRLRGEGLDFLVMDEAAFVKPDVWQQVLRPTLTERKGGALFISTPIGMNNWFYELWEMAEGKGDWERFQFPSWSNPLVDKEEVEQAKTEVGSIVYAQEYLAEFVEAGQGLLKPEWLKYFKEKNGRYFTGSENVSLDECTRFATVDLATSVSETADYTVIASCAVTPQGKILILDVDRQRMQAPDIIPRIRQKMAEYDLQWVGMERAGFQLSLIQFAKRDGLAVKELKADKDKISRAMPLAARMESGDIYFRQGAMWLPDVERELMTFPVGHHDDIVDAISYGVLCAQVRREWIAF